MGLSKYKYINKCNKKPAAHCTLSSVHQLAVDRGGDDGGVQVLQETSEGVSQRNHVVRLQVHWGWIWSGEQGTGEALEIRYIK